LLNHWRHKHEAGCTDTVQFSLSKRLKSCLSSIQARALCIKLEALPVSVAFLLTVDSESMNTLD
jgi:hypothetical protein